MVNKFTQEQRNEWIDLQMQKAEVLEALDTLEVVPPEDIEETLDADIEEVTATLLAIYEEKQARAGTDNPMSREEYIERTAAPQQQRVTLMESNEQIVARNEMRWGNAHRAHETAKEEKQAEIASLKITEKAVFQFTPPFEEKTVEK